VKPSYLYPAYFKFDTFIEHDLGIAGVHEVGQGYCGEMPYKRALALWLQRGQWSNNPTYIFESYNLDDQNDM
jgi:hypothetical protein